MQAGRARPKRLFAAAGASSGIADSRSGTAVAVQAANG